MILRALLTRDAARRAYAEYESEIFNTTPLDADATRRAVTRLYAGLGMAAAPLVLIFESPWDAIAGARQINAKVFPASTDRTAAGPTSIHDRLKLELAGNIGGVSGAVREQGGLVPSDERMSRLRGSILEQARRQGVQLGERQLLMRPGYYPLKAPLELQSRDVFDFGAAIGWLAQRRYSTATEPSGCDSRDGFEDALADYCRSVGMAWLLPDIAFVSDRPERIARAPETGTTTGSRDEAWGVGYRDGSSGRASSRG